MSNVSQMIWTPDVYVKILEVDLKEANELYKEIRYKLAVNDKSLSFTVGQFLQMVGKVQDNAKLLHQSMYRANGKDKDA